MACTLSSATGGHAGSYEQPPRVGMRRDGLSMLGVEGAPRASRRTMANAPPCSHNTGSRAPVLCRCFARRRPVATPKQTPAKETEYSYDGV